VWESVGGRCFYLLNDSGITAINNFGGETNNTREEGTSFDGFYHVAVLEECLWGQTLMFTEEICKLCLVFQTRKLKSTSFNQAGSTLYMENLLQFENSCNGRSEAGQEFVFLQSKEKCDISALYECFRLLHVTIR